MFGGNFAPRGWAFCEGQLLPINSNSALFSILGTTYGGDGRTTFGLPDLRGRVAIHPGNGPGLSSRKLGERIGSETNTLTVNQIPSHTHNAILQASSGAADSGQADGRSLAHETRGANNPDIYNSAAPTIAMNADAVKLTATGGGQSVNNIQPSLAVSYIVALEGVYPSRS